MASQNPAPNQAIKIDSRIFVSASYYFVANLLIEIQLVKQT